MESAMRHADYLRRQAQRCIALSRTTYDLATARQLRKLAEELCTKAAELDKEEPPLPLFMLKAMARPATSASANRQ
jgi:hypothetical protein